LFLWWLWKEPFWTASQRVVLKFKVLKFLHYEERLNFFYYRFVILLGCRSRLYINECARFQNKYFWNNNSSIRRDNCECFFSVFTAIWVRLYPNLTTHALGHCVIFSEKKCVCHMSADPPLVKESRIAFEMVFKNVYWHNLKQLVSIKYSCLSN